ncbi:endonuclease V [Endozoicomonas montiporae]|uniref:Endonuclease V n=1 Tax=Endozoicomonas montiporae TaxID=1027273 RepID=A0A081N895_9GAMM|nr:endonuclease V [Endozoicomonas montiporae]
MTVAQAHDWQQAMAERIVCHDDMNDVRTIAGVDVGFEENGTVTRSAVAVLAFPQLQLLDFTIARLPTCMPYIPGLLSFRETPAVLAALQQLTVKPDLLLCDGQGRAHPRRFGVACHVGLLSGIPAIGVGKQKLCGEHDVLPDEKNSVVALTEGQETIGTVLRSRRGVKPLYVSIGHRVSLTSAVHFVQQSLAGFKLPEPIRWADGLASNRGKTVEKANHILGRTS